MKKDIRMVDAERGIVQCTSPDERFYCRPKNNPKTGIPDSIEWRPSVTWICDVGYPKGRGFMNWLKNHGNESDDIARLAAERGYKVHRAIASLNEGNVVGIDDIFDNGEGQESPLTAEEYLAVMSFVQFWEDGACDEYEILESERTLWPDAAACETKYSTPSKYFEFAGTLDLKVRRRSDDTVGIIDMKTSSNIWPSHEMQVSAYARAEGADWQAILQLNYQRNKKQKYKFTLVDDCFDLFCATYTIWQREAENMQPLQRDYPLELKLKGLEAA